MTMTIGYYVNRLKECQNNADIESAHADADQVLCDLLVYLGYEEIVLAYNKVEKWYT